MRGGDGGELLWGSEESVQALQEAASGAGGAVSAAELWALYERASGDRPDTQRWRQERAWYRTADAAQREKYAACARLCMRGLAACSLDAGAGGRELAPLVSHLIGVPLADRGSRMQLGKLAMHVCLRRDAPNMALLEGTIDTLRRGKVRVEKVLGEALSLCAARGSAENAVGVLRLCADDARHPPSPVGAPALAAALRMLRAKGRVEEAREALLRMGKAPRQASAQASEAAQRRAASAISALLLGGERVAALEAARSVAGGEEAPSEAFFHELKKGFTHGSAKRESVAAENAADVLESLRPLLRESGAFHSCCILAWSWARLPERAERALRLKEEAGLPLTAKDFTLVLKAMKEARRTEEVERLFGEMLRCGVPLDPYPFNLTVMAHAEAGDVPRAMAVLDLMQEKGLELDIYSYGGLVRALSVADRPEDAQELVRSLADGELGDLEVRSGLYYFVLQAYAKTSRPDHAEALLRDMEAREKVTARALEIVVSAFVRAGRPADAERVLDEACAKGFLLGAATWHSVADLCRRRGFAQEESRLLEKMRRACF